MVRAAAKNFANVAVVTGVDAYPVVLEAIAAGGIGLDLRRRLAATAFERIAAYDRAIADWFADGADASVRSGAYRFVETPLRYGENAHQTAALWRDPAGHGLAQATQLHGKELSYNNMVDADAAVRAALDFDVPAVAVMKHANPCGIAVAPAHAVDPIAAAHRLANDCDPVSAFGGVIAANRTVTLGHGGGRRRHLHRGDRRARLRARGGDRAEAAEEPADPAAARGLRAPGPRVQAGLRRGARAGPRPVRRRRPGDLDARRRAPRPTRPTLADLAFAWRAVRAVKSNAILLASGGASVGIGMGQVNRVDSCHLAVTRAGERAAGSVAASDAFFPFADGAEVLLAGRREGDRAAGRLGPRPRGDRRCGGRGRDHVLHGRAPLLPLSSSARSRVGRAGFATLDRSDPGRPSRATLPGERTCRNPSGMLCRCPEFHKLEGCLDHVRESDRTATEPPADVRQEADMSAITAVLVVALAPRERD